MTKRKIESINQELPAFRQNFETAGHYLVASVPRALPTDTIGDARANLSKHICENIEMICVTDPAGKLA